MGAIAFTDSQLDRAYEMAERVGQAIRAAREQRGLSQAELAALLATSAAEVSKIECGKVPNLKLGNWLKYADALGLNLTIHGVHSS